MVSFIDKTGQRIQVNLQEGNPMQVYADAGAKKVSLRQHINSQYPTIPGGPDTFTQMCLSAGLRFKKNQETGEPAANLMEVLDPLASTNQTGGVNTNYPQIPDSRLLFPAAVMEAVESAIQTKETEAMGAFAELIAPDYIDTINTDRWEQPVLSFDGKKGPEDSAWRRIAQNSPPPLMLTLTSADVTRTIPTKACGLSISHKVLQSNTLDVIGRSLERFYVKSDYSEWVANLGLILSGDPDATNVPMATAKSALSSITAASLDASIIAAGVMTQDAWIKYLYRNSLSMRKTHIVTDLAGAMALDTRTNRPTNQMNNSIDRVDVAFQMIFPYGQNPVRVLAMPTGTWSANTYMGLDNKQAIGKVISSSADYQAVQDMVLLRNMQMIFTRGYLLYRLFDDSFDVLTTTV
jgi:hypothetical protein